eukprot:TRINITY_DN7744_c0_g3_i1.p1 TRINITY_DN7744_c0_g3~~TRINITY_DN7744_c0_g3_i1.p1  ORF type:complete len:249 (-),score=30.69 TRINITY_DN7744_c0_g3_i1:152-898(-)
MSLSDADSADVSDEAESSSESPSDSGIESLDFGASDDDSPTCVRIKAVDPSFIDALGIDEADDGLSSYRSCVEDDFTLRQTEATTRHTLQLTARVLEDGVRERPVFSTPLLIQKRIAIGDRALAREYIDRAAVSSRALVNLEMLQCKLPRACAARVAQFFRPTTTKVDIKRSFDERWPNGRRLCVDIDALRDVKPSGFVLDSKRKRRNPWESMHHALWCHAKWTRLFYPWVLKGEYEEAFEKELFAAC